MKNPFKAFLVSIILLAAISTGCEKKNNYPEVYIYETPDQLEDGWETESLGNAGMVYRVNLQTTSLDRIVIE